jgi:hypothetical protein
VKSVIPFAWYISWIARRIFMKLNTEEF